jgi:DNA-binding PadR family transcriptional regulator
LNFKKHSPILGKLETKGLISKDQIELGKRTVTAYKPTQKGIEFSRQILEPYEIMFPRTDIMPEDNLAFLLVLIKVILGCNFSV